jgi:hypothetical protein
MNTEDNFREMCMIVWRHQRFVRSLFGMHCGRSMSSFWNAGKLAWNTYFLVQGTHRTFVKLTVKLFIEHRCSSVRNFVIMKSHNLTYFNPVQIGSSYALGWSLWPVENRFRNYESYKQSVGLHGQWSALRKAAVYTGQHNHRINADIHTSNGIRTHYPSVWAGENAVPLDRMATVIGYRPKHLHLFIIRPCLKISFIYLLGFNSFQYLSLLVLQLHLRIIIEIVSLLCKNFRGLSCCRNNWQGSSSICDCSVYHHPKPT